MTIEHPLSQRRSAIWHARFVLIGVAHLIAGIGMCWFHGISAARHWRERER